MITSKQISELLVGKYTKDFVCIPQCKIGGAWHMNNCQIIDMWCMAKSWAHPRTIGFEIKVSRNDFLRDIKWREYLNYCTEFYFVAPPDIIAPDELPPEAGLMITSKNVKMLVTKKKAPMIDVDIPESIYRYILMWRAKITDEDQTPVSNSEYWKEWLETKAINGDIGYKVSRKVSEIVRNRIEKTEDENLKLKREIKNLQEVKQFLESIKFDPRNFQYRNKQESLRDIIRRIDKDIPKGLIESIESSMNSLKTAHTILTEV
jgi:hypothetical protein